MGARGWEVEATAINKTLEEKWNGMCSTWSWLDMKEEVWPNVMVSDGNGVMSAMELRPNSGVGDS